MSVVRVDKHGVYVLAGGYLFRPIFPVGLKHFHDELVPVEEKEKVKVKHIGGTSLAKVDVPGHNSMHWYSHGDYFDIERQKNIESHLLFKPERETW